MNTPQTPTITAYRNLATGELVPPHQIGTDEQGRSLYLGVEGHEPVEPHETDEDGNWVAIATETATLYRVQLISATSDGNWASQCREQLYPSREAAQAAIDADETTQPDGFGGSCEVEIVAVTEVDAAAIGAHEVYLMGRKAYRDGLSLAACPFRGGETVGDRYPWAPSRVWIDGWMGY